MHSLHLRHPSTLAPNLTFRSCPVTAWKLLLTPAAAPYPPFCERLPRPTESGPYSKRHEANEVQRRRAGYRKEQRNGPALLLSASPNINTGTSQKHCITTGLAPNINPFTHSLCTPLLSQSPPPHTSHPVCQYVPPWPEATLNHWLPPFSLTLLTHPIHNFFSISPNLSPAIPYINTCPRS
jgi:hypothetical protein